METRKRKNIIAIVNIILFAIVLFIGIFLISADDLVIGWVLILLSVMIIIFSTMSLFKRRKEDSDPEG